MRPLLVPLYKMLFIFWMAIFISACGPGIPLSPTISPLISLSNGDDLNQTVSLSDPTLSYVNSDSEESEFIFTLSRELSSLLSVNQIILVKTGSVDGIVNVTGSGTQYTITISNFTGNGTLSLNFVIGSTTYMFSNKIVTVDNTIPSQTSAITLPPSPVSTDSATISWEAVEDSSIVSYQAKICSDNLCTSSCTTSIEGSETEVLLEELVDGDYYACVQTVDQAGNLSGFKASSTTFIVYQTPLSLLASMVTLSSPSNGTTTSDVTPIIVGSGIEPSTTLSIYSDSSCTSLLSSDTVANDGTVSLSNINLSNDGTVHFYGKVTFYSLSTGCIDLEKEYLLDTTAPLLQSLTNLSLSSPSNGTTSSDKTPLLSGEGEDGVTLALYDSSSCTTALETTIISGGAFSFNAISYNDLTDDGVKAFHIKLTDELGNISSCEDLNLSYRLDTTSPSDPVSWELTSPTDGITSNDTTPSVTKSTLASENGSSVFIFDNIACSTSVGTAVISDGSLAVTNISYASNGTDDGTKNFYALITDSAGNSSNCVDLNLFYFLDTVAPSDPTGWSITSPSSGVTSNDTTPVIEGLGLSSENGGSVEIFDSVGCSGNSIGSSSIAGGVFTVNDISYPSDGSGDGTLSFYGKIIDIAGNESSCIDLSLGYKLDTTAPTTPSGWTISSPNSGTTSSDITPQIAGSGLAVENGGSVSIYDSAGCGSSIGTATISGGSFTVSNITYLNDGSQDGTKTFYGKISDTVGNSSSCVSLSLAYKLDTTNPSNPSGWTISSPSNGTSSNDNTPQIAGSGLSTENGSSVAIYDSSSCIDIIGSTTISGGSFSVTNITYAVDGSDDGEKLIYGKIVDISGNDSSCVALGLGYLYDHTNPSDPTGWSMSTPNSGVTSSDVTPQISGSGLAVENGGTAAIYDNGACVTPVGSAVISGGVFTVSNITYLSDGSQDGTKTLYGKITDAAGNDSSCIDLSFGYLLDTEAPSNPSGWTMSSPNNGTTSNDITPQIGGAGLAMENGGSVSIYDSAGCGSSIGTAIIAGGTFTVSNMTYLNDGSQDGTKEFYGMITDSGGNSSSCVSLSLEYKLDTTNPSNPNGWTMSSPNSGTTSNDENPQISGAGLSAENGASVSIYDDGSCVGVIGSASIAGGSFTVSNITYAVDGTDDGTKSFYGKIVDVSGNSSTCVNLGLSYLYDHTNPSNPSGWTMSSPSSGVTSNDAIPQIGGSGLASENGGSVTIYGAGACSVSLGTAVISGGSFTVTNITYLSDGSQDGQKTLYGKMTDAAGNESGCIDLSLGYLLDTIAPSNPSGWTMSSPNNGTTSNDITPQISKGGLAIENSSTVTIYDNIACADIVGTAEIAGGTFTVSNITYLNNGTQDGTKTFYAEITDKGGNSSSCVDLSLGYLLDTTNPSNPSGWTMNSPNTAVTSNDATPEISGAGLAAENGSSISIYDSSGCAVPIGSAVIAGGVFTVSNISYLTDGSNDGTKTFYGKISDVGGNSSGCVNLTLGYKLDTIVPLDPVGWSFTNVTNGETSGNFTPQISGAGLAAENKSVVNIYLTGACGASVGSAVINAGIFTVTNIAFLDDGSADGDKAFFGTITDAGGNISTCTDLSLAYRLDTTIPSVSISVPTTSDFINDANMATFTISGECSENGRTVTVNATGGLSATPSCTGTTWTTTLDFTAVANGPITITADHDNVALTPAPQADVTLTKDSAIPADPSGWTLGSPNDGITSSDYTPQISGGGLAAENGASIDIYTAVGCVTAVGTAEVSGGTFTVSNITFVSDGSADGAKSFYGKITDVAGNSSSCVDLTLSYLLDTINPSNPSGWTMASPNTATTSNDVTPEISSAGLAVENGSSVTIYDAIACSDGVGSATIAGGSFTVSNITYQNDGTDDGTKTFYGKIVDSAGNSSSCISLNLGYKIDTTVPSNPTGWTIASPVNGVTSSDATPQISGSDLSSENGGSVTIYDALACAVPVGTATISSGNFTVSNMSYDVDGSDDGTKTFYGKITDVGGNDSGCIALGLSYLFDTTSPSDPSGWTMSSPNTGTTSNDNTPQISGGGLAAENGSSVTIHAEGACGGAIGSALIAGGTFAVTNISYLNDGTQDGTKTYYGVITDTAGNSSNCTDLSLGYLLDTTVPSNPSGWTMSSPNSGTTSNDSTPQIDGSGLAGENGGAITISNSADCSGLVGSATIAGGAFTVSDIFYANDGSVDGTKSFYGKITDVGGNSSSCVSLNLSYKLDTIDPSDPTGWSLASPSSGATTNDSTPQISGSGLSSENGGTVTLYDAGGCVASIGTATISSGSFTVSNISYLNNGTQDGTKTFYGKVTDVGGNESNCVDLSLSYLLDTTSPSNPSGWTMSTPNTGTTSNDNTPQVSGSGLAAENGSSVAIHGTGTCSSALGSAVIAGGTFTVSNITYLNNGTQDGTKAFYGLITDIAGNNSSCTNLSLGYLFDTTAPNNPSGWTMSSPSTGTTSSDYTPQISGSGLAAENGGTITISNTSDCSSSVGSATIAGGAFTVSNITFASNGSADGSKTFYGKITDVGGNSSSCVSLSLSYLLDTTAPSDPSAWTMSSPSSGATSNDYTPQISKSGLSSENGSSVTISNAVDCSSSVGSATISGGSFTVSNITYASNGSQDGTKTFYGKITDIAGNSSSCTALSLSYLLDTTAPSNPSSWSMSSPSTGTTSNDYTPQISKSGLAGENTSTVSIYDAGACSSSIGSATIAGGSFTVSNIAYASNGTQDGTKAFYGKIVDVAGNSSSCVTLSLGYLLDTTAPSNPSAWTMSSPSTGTTSNDYTPQISKTGLSTENGTTAYIYNAVGCVTSVGSATIAGGSFTVSNITYANNGSVDGTKTFYGKLTDAGGNSSSCVALSLSYVLDTTNPTVSLASPISSDVIDYSYFRYVTVSGSCSENGRSVTIGATGSLSATPSCSSGSYSTTLDFDSTADGSITITANHTDIAGNSATQASVTLTKDIETKSAVRSISYATYYGCVILSNSSVKCWGTNNGGHLGYGHTNNLGDGIYEMGDNLSAVLLGTNLTATQVFALGTGITCAVLSNSALKCWGTNGSGHLGQGHTNHLGDNAGEMGTNLSTINLGTNIDVYQVSVGSSEVCAIITGGNVKCWGNNQYANLGQGNVTSLGDNAGEMGNNLSTIQLGTNRKALSVSAAYAHTCVLLDNSTVKCFGNGNNGKLGGTSNTIGDVPNEMGDNLSTVNVGASRSVIKLTNRNNWGCVLLDNSTVKCWGNNDGNLGQGHTTSLGNTQAEMGDNLSILKFGTSGYVVDGNTGVDHGCVILDSGNLKCWGLNTGGRLGQGHLNIIADNPDEMGNNLSTIKLGTNKKPYSVAVGGTATCVLLTDGGVKCFGDGLYGGLGQGNQSDLGDAANEMGDNLSYLVLSTPSQSIKDVFSSTNSISCALLGNSTLKCWGLNTNAQLGQGNTATKGDGANEMGNNLSTINLNDEVIKVSAGNNHACALLSGQKVKCWGYGNVGRLGQGNANDIGDQADEMGSNLSSINFGSRFPIDISVAGASSCALLDNGNIACWGYGVNAQLGRGTTVDIGDNAGEMGSNLSTINLGGSAVLKMSLGNYQNCALLEDATVKCWGTGGNLGQGHANTLGDEANEMGNNLSTVNVGTNLGVMQISSGESHTCVLLTNGTIKCWGGAAFGQLGQGNAAKKGDGADEMGDNLSTINLGANRTILSINAAYSSSCALLDDYTLRCWGYNNYGQLGQGHTNNIGDNADEMGTNLSAINLGSNKKVLRYTTGYHSCALLDDSTAKCWGLNTNGRLGQGHTENLGDEANEMGSNLSAIILY